MTKLEWKNSSKGIGGRYKLEAMTSARYEDRYLRFYIVPITHDGEAAWELRTGCGVDGLIASGFDKKDLKSIAQELQDGERVITYITERG